MILEELGFSLPAATTLMEDNKSTIAIALNPVNHQRTKHIDTRVHQIRHHVKHLDVDIVYCPTEDMIADIFTKALPGAQHIKLTGMLGLIGLADLQGRSSIPQAMKVTRLIC
jgi:KUP system potassium uptake protein